VHHIRPSWTSINPFKGSFQPIEKYGFIGTNLLDQELTHRLLAFRWKKAGVSFIIANIMAQTCLPQTIFPPSSIVISVLSEGDEEPECRNRSVIGILRKFGEPSIRLKSHIQSATQNKVDEVKEIFLTLEVSSSANSKRNRI
jgi:hypothetical protein